NGRAFLEGSMLGESRQNGTVLQENGTTIRQLSTGYDWDSSKAGSFTVRVYGGTENYRQNFTSISADRNTEALTRDQHVPVYQIGGSAQWSRGFGHHFLVAGTDVRVVDGRTDEIGYFAGNPTSRLLAGGRQNTVGVF